MRRAVGKLAGQPGRALVRRALRRERPPDERWLLADLWAQRPRTHEWFADVVLREPLLAEALGDAWLHATRAGFLRGERRASEMALQAAGPVALAATLRGLQHPAGA